MQKKQDTSSRYHSIKINSEEVFILKDVLERYMIEQEALAYKDTHKIDAYPIYMRVKHLISIYELQNPRANDS